MIKLGVNVDHVATIRQARGTTYPDPLEAALLAVCGGADQITIHLREDRRHIQDSDLKKMRESLSVPLNLEMAASEDIIAIACKIGPHTATLVPEKRQELTTEGGLDLASNAAFLSDAVARLSGSGIEVSMFIDPEIQQIEAAARLGAHAVEFHTGRFCGAFDGGDETAASQEMERLKGAVKFASGTAMRICAGHGINYANAVDIARALPQVVEYNIGHAIVARAIFVGMENAVREMKDMLIR